MFSVLRHRTQDEPARKNQNIPTDEHKNPYEMGQMTNAYTSVKQKCHVIFMGTSSPPLSPSSHSKEQRTAHSRYDYVRRNFRICPFGKGRR